MCFLRSGICSVAQVVFFFSRFSPWVFLFFPCLILQLDVGNTIVNGSCKLAWGCCRKSKFNAGCLTAQGNSSSREVLGRLGICRNEMRSARVRDRGRSGNVNPNTR